MKLYREWTSAEIRQITGVKDAALKEYIRLGFIQPLKLPRMQKVSNSSVKADLNWFNFRHAVLIRILMLLKRAGINRKLIHEINRDMYYDLETTCPECIVLIPANHVTLNIQVKPICDELAQKIHECGF